jgi:MinD-like ATPase involved in chromosome partitioning or flagellar assembly
MDLHGRIRAPLLSTFKVGFVGKGGVGKTTVTASVGSILAHVRHGDPVVAIDADTGFGKLASRIDDRAVNSYWELVAEDADVGFAGVQSHLGANSAGLFVLPGDPRTASRRRVLSPAVYRAAATRMEEHFGVVLVDCSATMDTPVTHEALADLDAAIVVASPWADGASVAGQTMAWLAVYGYGELLRRTIVVVNDSDGHGVKRNKAELVGRFGELGHPVFNLPFDGSLRSGGIIDTTNGIASATRLSLLQIAAAVAQYFPEGALEHRNR